VEKESTSIQEAMENRKNPSVNANEKAHKPVGRPKRIPLSKTSKLELPAGIKEDGYAYRFILNRPERIQMYESAWWEAVMDGEGKNITKPSGNKENRQEHLLLYRTKVEYFEEDLRENRKKPIDLVKENAKLTKGTHSSEYVPEGHEAVVSINNSVV
jgi:hypothetical protein